MSNNRLWQGRPRCCLAEPPGLALLALALIAFSAQAQEHFRAKEPPVPVDQLEEFKEWAASAEEISFRPAPRAATSKFTQALDYVDNDNVPTAHSVYFAPGDRKWLPPHGVHFPPLKKGSIVPIYGFLYRLAELEKNGPGKGSQGKGKDTATLRRLNAGEIPGLSAKPGSCSIPLNKSETDFALGNSSPGCVRLGSYAQEVIVRLENVFQRQPSRLTARVSLQWFLRNDIAQRAEVEIGDVLMIGEQGYPILAIVPPDEKTGAIGWVEMESLPLSAEELEKAKSLVRPKSVDFPGRRKDWLAWAAGLPPDYISFGKLPLSEGGGVTAFVHYGPAGPRGVVSWQNPYHVCSHSVAFPPLKEGDVVPIFGHLHQFTEGMGSMRLKRLPPDAVKGLTVHPNSCAIPLKGNATDPVHVGFGYHDLQLRLTAKSIEVPKEGAASALLVVNQVYMPGPRSRSRPATCSR